MASGQESLRLAYARHLPLTREAFCGAGAPEIVGAAYMPPGSLCRRLLVGYIVVGAGLARPAGFP